MTDRFRIPGATDRLRVLVVGSVSRDRTRGAPPGAGRPGGVATYAGLAHAQLGAGVRVVTSLRRTDDSALLAPLRTAGVAVRTRDSRRTTTCVNDYRGPVDLHALRARSDPIRLADVPPSWRRCDVVQLGPLHPRDVLPEVASGVTALRGLDVQGLLRGPGRAVAPAWLATLAACHVVQVSQTDAPHLLAGDTLERWRRRFGVAELVVTRGARGAIVLTDRGRTVVLARRIVVRHPTGAGDVFLAAYLEARVRGRGPARAGDFAARVAAATLACGHVSRAVWRRALG